MSLPGNPDTPPRRRTHRLREVILPGSLAFGDAVCAIGGLIAGYGMRYHTPIAELGIATPDARLIDYLPLIAVGAVMLMATYIHQLLQKRKISSVQDIRDTIYEAGLKRIRPCMMTTVTTLAALIPVLISTGRGADVARAMAIPVFGGMMAEPLTSFIVPTLYSAYLEMKMRFGFYDELWEAKHPTTESEELMKAA